MPAGEGFGKEHTDDGEKGEVHVATAQQSRIVKFPKQVKKQRRRRRRFSFMLFCICVVLIYFGYTYSVQSAQLKELLAQEKALVERFQALQDEIEYLQREVERLGTDEYIEKLARERLGLVRPQDAILQAIPNE